jgi:amino acid adenylation domain-containing protein
VAACDRLADAAPAGRLVPDLVADVAAARPDATALVCGEVRLTYRQLLERADALADVLRARGVGPGVPVGLLLPRSAELGVAALAVLRAGGAYVPLDRAQPAARLAHMVATSGTALLVTAAETAGQAEPLGVPCVRADLPLPPVPPGPAPAPRPRPGDLAYVLFTSGSTGVPKGVAVEHRALRNLVEAVRPVFPVTEHDRVLQFVSFGFDVAVSDLFFPWAAGAELHVPREEDRLGEALLETLRASRITYVFLPPSAAMLLPDTTGLLPDLRTVAVGGEACPAELVERLAAPGRRVVNAYGPSEVTVYATTADLEPGAPVVIGRPVPGVRLYVLDGRLRPVPAGVTGEVYLTGASLARGYTGRPGLTAERFVADPHGAPGSRMYRTGDLGRIDADGVVHYLGRGDWQVKLRGVRIELGEVEAVLAAHPDVAVAAAAVRGGEGAPRLVAYVVARPGTDPADEDLRAHLVRRLPAHMVPEALVRLAELPLSTAGKVDRSRLPDPGTTTRRTDRPLTGARTATERLLAGVWEQVLSLDRVGAHDNFFDLGGNSVRLLAVLNGLRERGADAGVTLVDLFRHPTVAALAARLDRPAAPAAAPAAPPPGGASPTAAPAPGAPADGTTETAGTAPAAGTGPAAGRFERRTATARRIRSRKGTTR